MSAAFWFLAGFATCALTPHSVLPSMKAAGYVFAFAMGFIANCIWQWWMNSPDDWDED